MGNTTRSGGRGRSEREREAQRERRRAYYEQLSPEEKRAYRERRLRRKKLKKLKRMAVSGGIMLALIIISVIGILIQQGGKRTSQNTPVSGTQPANGGESGQSTKTVTVPDWVTQDLIRVNEYSRPGTKLERVSGVVVHYVGNPQTTAKNNRDYFDSLADTKETNASSHFVIDIDGSILQCIPLDEIAYASNSRNEDTISIECCHPDETGKFSDATYASLVKLVKWLEETYNLKPESVIRHYDVKGKMCPLYYVEHEDAWEQFHRDIALE